MSCELVCIEPTLIETIWPHLAPLLDKATARFGSNDERTAIETDLRKGMALAWIAWSDERKIEAALVTDIWKEDDYKVCRLRALAGNSVMRWVSLLRNIEDYARKEQCKFVRYVGRRGWAVLMGEDYKVTHIIAQKEI